MAIERYTGLASVLETIRWQDGITQATLTDQVGLGRSVVAELALLFDLIVYAGR